MLWGSLKDKPSFPEKELRPYAIKRIYRLFPVALVSAILMGLLVPATAFDLSMNALMLRTNLNGVLWSLQVELAGSALIFLLWTMARARSRFIWLSIVPVAFAAAAYKSQIVAFVPGYIFLFMPAFVLGSLIFKTPNGFF